MGPHMSRASADFLLAKPLLGFRESSYLVPMVTASRLLRLSESVSISPRQSPAPLGERHRSIGDALES
jgi:hypothetical protein